MRIIVIYGLHDPRNDELRYIGKTARDRMMRRLWEHRSEAAMKENNPRNRWLRSLLRLGISPEMRVIEETTEAAWQECERRWISYFRQIGARLTNTTEGGEGGATCKGRKWTEERRKHISEMFKGHAVSDKTLAILRARRKGRDHWRWIEFDNVQLRKLYVDRRLSSRQIAITLGCDQCTVLRRLHELGLVRTNSEAKSGRVLTPADKARKGKLSPADVRKIRALINERVPLNKIAAMYEMNWYSISNIKRGITWQWLN
jgi:hypothetical protein